MDTNIDYSMELVTIPSSDQNQSDQNRSDNYKCIHRDRMNYYLNNRAAHIRRVSLGLASATELATPLFHYISR